MASAPIKQKGKYKVRGQPYALVTNRPSEKIKGEVNFIAGYTFKKEAKVKVKIGKKASLSYLQKVTRCGQKTSRRI